VEDAFTGSKTSAGRVGRRVWVGLLVGLGVLLYTGALYLLRELVQRAAPK
jgi:hypothetical protein